MDLNKWHCIDAEQNIWMTPKMRTDFVALAKPFKRKDAKPDAKAKYAMSGIIPPTCDFTKVKAAINKLARTAFADDTVDFYAAKPKSRGLKQPIGDPDEKEMDPEKFGLEDLAGYSVMRFTSSNPVPVMGLDGVEIDRDEIQTQAYTGRYMRAEIRIKDFRVESKGITCYLERVQLLANAKPTSTGGSPAKGPGAFTAVDDEDEIDANSAMD